MKVERYEELIADNYSTIVDKPLSARHILGMNYLFGSEIATLRLYKYLVKTDRTEVDHGYSENYGAFFVSFRPNTLPPLEDV